MIVTAASLELSLSPLQSVRKATILQLPSESCRKAWSTSFSRMCRTCVPKTAESLAFYPHPFLLVVSSRNSLYPYLFYFSLASVSLSHTGFLSIPIIPAFPRFPFRLPLFTTSMQTAILDLLPSVYLLFFFSQFSNILINFPIPNCSGFLDPCWTFSTSISGQYIKVQE